MEPGLRKERVSRRRGLNERDCRECEVERTGECEVEDSRGGGGVLRRRGSALTIQNRVGASQGQTSVSRDPQEYSTPAHTASLVTCTLFSEIRPSLVCFLDGPSSELARPS